MLKISDKWIPFGSRKWGGWTKESDTDYIVFAADIAHLVIDDSGEHRATYSRNNSLHNSYHFYIKEHDMLYNFIVYENYNDFQLAKIAVKQVDLISKTALGRPMSLQKHFRHTIVEETFASVFAHFDGVAPTLDISKIYSEYPQEEVVYALQELEVKSTSFGMATGFIDFSDPIPPPPRPTPREVHTVSVTDYAASLIADAEL